MRKYDVCKHIESYLNNLKIRYEISGQDAKGCTYEIFVASTSGFIKIEYDLDDNNNNEIFIELNSKLKFDGDIAMYESFWENDNNYNSLDSLESEIHQLVDSIKRIEEGIAIIKYRIEQIKNICDAMDIDYAEFITLNYNFN